MTSVRVKLRARVKQLGQGAKQDTTLASRRTRLRNRIAASNRTLSQLLPEHDDFYLSEDGAQLFDHSDGSPDERTLSEGRGGSLRYDLRALAEDLIVDLPSSRTFTDEFSPSANENQAIQLELRLACVGMDVSLSDLRRGLVDQAYIFRRDIRQSASSGNVKLGYDAAKKAREHARQAAASNRLFADTYRMLWDRCEALHFDKMSRMGRSAWELHSDHYQVLSGQDIQCDTSTYDVKDHSGRLDLPWFWKLDRRPCDASLDDDEYIADCGSIFSFWRHSYN